MSEWKKVRLGDCCLVGDGSHASLKRQEKGILYITAKNLTSNGLDISKVDYISEELFNKHFKDNTNSITRPIRNDIIFSIIGSLGACYLVKDEKFGISSSVAIFRSKGEIIPLYLFYYLKSETLKSEINSIKGGVAQGFMSLSKLGSLSIYYPSSIKRQHRIATILSRYDDLIENYQRQIKLLEEAAQRLYKEWFVDFRFPGHETTKFVDGIPEGWDITSVDNIIEKLESGSRPKGGIDTSIKEGIASVGAENVIGPGLYNFSSEKLVSYDFYKNAKKGKIENKDILIYKDGAYIGRTSLFQDNFPHKEAMVNEHVFLLHTKEEINQYFLFFTLYQKVYFEKMQKLNKNAAQPGLNQNAIKSLKLLMPNKKYIVKFDEVISPMMKKLFALANQIRSLTEARDRLLPKLMNGEIEV